MSRIAAVVVPSRRSGLVLRPLRPRDLDRVVAIERQVYVRPWSRATFASEIDRADRAYLVACGPRRLLGSDVVGYGGVSVAVGEAHVLTVAVRRDAQCRGVGATLLLRLLEHAREQGATAATLEVRPSNDRARALYRRFGFDEVGRRPRYYRNDGEDAVIMWLHGLGDGATTVRLQQEAARLGVLPGAPPALERPRRPRRAGAGYRDVL